MKPISYKGKPAHLDYDSKREQRFVFDQKSGEFVAPLTPPLRYIKMIPVGWLSRALELSPSAVRVSLACWFMDGCNKQKPFVLTQATCQQFLIDKYDKRRGQKHLENAGLIEILRRPGRSNQITMIRGRESVEAGDTGENNSENPAR